MSEWRLNFSKSRLPMLLLILGIGLIVALAVPTTFQYSKFEKLEREWNNFAELSAAKTRRYAELSSSLGYGGLIHHFKNYLLRREPSYIDSFFQSKAEVEVVLGLLENEAGLSQQERGHLVVIRETSEAYNAAFDLMLSESFDSIESSDKRVRIDDVPALNAISELQALHDSEWQRQSEILTGQISRALDLTLLLLGFTIFSVAGLVFLARMIVKSWTREIREQNKVLYFLQEETNEGWWDWKVQENYEYMSPRFWKTFGIDPKKMKHEPSEWMNIIHPEDKDKALEAFDRHAKSFGAEPYTVEVRYKHADGHWVTVLCRGRVVEWDNESRPIRMVGTHTDVSALKKVQSDLELANNRIALDSKLSTMGQIAGNIAHEINNPIAIASGSAQLIERKLKKGIFDRDKIIEHSEAMTVSLKRAADIVKGLKSLSSNGDSNSWECFLLRESIEEIHALVESKFRMYEVNFKLSCSKDLVVCARRVQVHQVIANLVNNAFDAVKDLREREIEIHAEEDKEGLTIRVFDSGPGPSEDIQAKMMEPFFTTKTEGQGTGMGLSLSQKIMESHYGSLAFDANAKRSCFVLRFPKKELLDQAA